jgi:hypothetical protein
VRRFGCHSCWLSGKLTEDVPGLTISRNFLVEEEEVAFLVVKKVA